MNRITGFLLLTLFGTLTIGCGRGEPRANGRSAADGARGQSQVPKTERDAMEYTSAEVRFLSGDLANRRKRIDDQVEIRRLLSFFAGAGGGHKGPEPPAPWKKAMLVRFTRAEGTVLRVTSSYQFWNDGPYHGTYFWSEGRGDWLLADPDEFGSYLRKLFQEEGKSEKQGEE